MMTMMHDDQTSLYSAPQLIASFNGPQLTSDASGFVSAGGGGCAPWEHYLGKC